MCEEGGVSELVCVAPGPGLGSESGRVGAMEVEPRSGADQAEGEEHLKTSHTPETQLCDSRRVAAGTL